MSEQIIVLRVRQALAVVIHAVAALGLEPQIARAAHAVPSVVADREACAAGVLATGVPDAGHLAPVRERDGEVLVCGAVAVVVEPITCALRVCLVGWCVLRVEGRPASPPGPRGAIGGWLDGALTDPFLELTGHLPLAAARASPSRRAGEVRVSRVGEAVAVVVEPVADLIARLSGVAAVALDAADAGRLTRGRAAPDPAVRGLGHEALIGRAVTVVVHAVAELILRALVDRGVQRRTVGAVRDPVTVDVPITAHDALTLEADLSHLFTDAARAATSVRPARRADAARLAVGHAGAPDADLALLAQGRGLLVRDAVAVIVQRVAQLAADGVEGRAGEVRAVLVAEDHAPVARAHAAGLSSAVEAAPVGEHHLEALVGVAVAVIIRAVAGLVPRERGRAGVDLGALLAGQEPRGRAASLPAAGLRDLVVFVRAAVAVVVDPVAARLGLIAVAWQVQRVVARVAREPDAALAQRGPLHRARTDTGLQLTRDRVISQQVLAIVRVGEAVAVVVEPVAHLERLAQGLQRRVDTGARRRIARVRGAVVLHVVERRREVVPAVPLERRDADPGVASGLHGAQVICDAARLIRQRRCATDAVGRIAAAQDAGRIQVLAGGRRPVVARARRAGLPPGAQVSVLAGRAVDELSHGAEPGLRIAGDLDARAVGGAVTGRWDRLRIELAAPCLLRGRGLRAAEHAVARVLVAEHALTGVSGGRVALAGALRGLEGAHAGAADAGISQGAGVPVGAGGPVWRRLGDTDPGPGIASR